MFKDAKLCFLTSFHPYEANSQVTLPTPSFCSFPALSFCASLIFFVMLSTLFTLRKHLVLLSVRLEDEGKVS